MQEKDVGSMIYYFWKPFWDWPGFQLMKALIMMETLWQSLQTEIPLEAFWKATKSDSTLT